jgi:hypothetical protein
MINRQKATRSVVVGSFAGLASIPGFFYALVVRPVQDVENGTVKSASRQAAILHDASNIGRILFMLGVVFLVLLVVFLIIGFRLQQRVADDIEEAIRQR